MGGLNRCLPIIEGATIKRALCLLLLCAASISTPGIAQQKPAPHLPQVLPGSGIADPARKTGFFPNPKGGIDALDLATGMLLWTNPAGGQPLLATDSLLIVQKANAIDILATSADGKLLREAKPLGFPGWVSVGVAYGRTFRSSARVEGKTVWLTWEARAFYAGGARPTPEIEKRERKEASGVARIELDTGKVTALSADEIATGKLFVMSAETANPKVGELTLVVKDGAAKNPQNPFQKRRTLQAWNAEKQLEWERDVAAPVFLLPRP